MPYKKWHIDDDTYMGILQNIKKGASFESALVLK